MRVKEELSMLVPVPHLQEERGRDCISMTPLWCLVSCANPSAWGLTWEWQGNITEEESSWIQFWCAVKPYMAALGCYRLTSACRHTHLRTPVRCVQSLPRPWRNHTWFMPSLSCSVPCLSSLILNPSLWSETGKDCGYYREENQWAAPPVAMGSEGKLLTCE